MTARYTQSIVTPPAIEPVLVGEMKAWLGADCDANEDILASLIATARVAAEQYTGRAFISQVVSMTLDGGCARNIPWMPGVYDLPVNYFDDALPITLVLPVQPVRSIVSITTYGNDDVSAIFDPTGYALVGDRMVVRPGYRWPSQLRSHSPATIVYEAGYGRLPSDVPAPIRTAIKMDAQRMYEGGEHGNLKMLKAGNATLEYFGSSDGIDGRARLLLDAYRVYRL